MQDPAETTVDARLDRIRNRRRRFRRGVLILFGLMALGVAMAWWNMIRMPGKSHRGALPAGDEELALLAEELRQDVAHRRCAERQEKIVAMLSLETIGYYDDAAGSQNYPPPFGLLYPSEGNFIGFIGNTASGDLVRQAVGTFRKNEPFPCEGAALPESVPGVGLSDQWSFWQEGYPALMVTDTAMFRYPHYHTPKDTIDQVDFDRTARVVRGLEYVIAELVGADRRAE